MTRFEDLMDGQGRIRLRIPRVLHTVCRGFILHSSSLTAASAAAEADFNAMLATLAPYELVDEPAADEPLTVEAR